MLPRTYLFVPGDRPERFPKAQASGADIVVMDLEDAVRPESKGMARDHVASALSQGNLHACVRINGSDSEWFEEDCRLLALPGVSGLMLPKAEDVESVDAASSKLAEGKPVIPIVESARGLAAATALAGCAHVLRLAFGSVDFQLDLGIEGDGMELLFARSQLVLSSRLAGVRPPIDGVTLSVSDSDQLRQDTLHARRMGFGAKFCIHPSQVAIVNEVLTPDAQTIAWARRVIAAASATTAGAIVVDGQLVDKPIVDRARACLARAGI